MKTAADNSNKRLRVLLIGLAVIPWIAINYYWIRIGELDNPIWMIVMNALIAFLAFVGPALNRGFRKNRPED